MHCMMQLCGPNKGTSMAASVCAVLVYRAETLVRSHSISVLRSFGFWTRMLGFSVRTLLSPVVTVLWSQNIQGYCCLTASRCTSACCQVQGTHEGGDMCASVRLRARDAALLLVLCGCDNRGCGVTAVHGVKVCVIESAF
jgi:hypothetical protein